MVTGGLSDAKEATGEKPAHDYFALLGEPRRPSLDPESLKRKFLELSARWHPDRIHQAPAAEREAAGRLFAELNAAYQCLRDPKERLGHLLELELGRKPAGLERVPDQMTVLFFEVGRLCKGADAFLADKARVTSPVMQASLFERGQEWVDKLRTVQKGVEARRDELLAELQAMNPSWAAAAGAGSSRAPLPLERLEEIHRRLGYFSRWLEQVQERIVRLSL